MIHPDRELWDKVGFNSEKYEYVKLPACVTKWLKRKVDNDILLSYYYYSNNGIKKNIMNEKCNVRCPKCGSKTLYAYEHIIAESQHKIVDGIWRHEHDNNEYGDGIDITFRCDRCQHFWKGRKGVTIESYLIDD